MVSRKKMIFKLYKNFSSNISPIKKITNLDNRELELGNQKLESSLTVTSYYLKPIF